MKLRLKVHKTGDNIFPPYYFFLPLIPFIICILVVGFRYEKLIDIKDMVSVHFRSVENHS